MVTLLVVVAASVMAVMAVVFAAPAGAETTIAVSAGAAGRYQPGRPVPVTVTVTADRLVQGTIRVTVNTAGNANMGIPTKATAETPIEVGGGSTKQVVVVVPSDNRQNNADSRFSADVELRQGDVVLAKEVATAKFEAWTEAVGVLPGLAKLGPLPDTAPMALGAGTATLVPLDTVALEAGAGGLGPYPTLVALPSDIAQLSAPARQGLLLWLNDGGRLLIDGADNVIAGLPEAWQPIDGWARAGSGSVHLTHSQAQAGQWSTILLPTAGGSSGVDAVNQGAMNGVGNVSSAAIAAALGRDAGFQLPELGVLVGFLVLYVVLVGPVTFIALAKLQRRTLAWFIVPALAVLFTGGFAVGGARLRQTLDSAHATVLDITPAGARAFSTALVGSINGGRTELRMPAGWGPEAVQTQSFGSTGMIETPVPPIIVHPDGSAAVMNLDPGEFDLINASGPVAGYDRALVVDAASDGASITGTVTNNLDVALDEVTIVVNNVAIEIGRVEAKQHKPYTIAKPLDSNAATMSETQGWPVAPDDSGGMGFMTSSFAAPTISCDANGCVNSGSSSGPTMDNDTAVNLPMWTGFAGKYRRLVHAADAVTAIGWTKQLPSPLSLDGDRPVTRGRTAVMAHGPIRVSNLDTIGVRMEMVRDIESRKREPDEVEPVDWLFNGSEYRFVLPEHVNGQRLDPISVLVRAPVDLHRIAIYSANGWKVTPELTLAGIAYRLAPEDIVNGAIHIRIRAGDQLKQRGGTATGPYLGWKFTVAGPVPDEVGTTPPDVSSAPTPSVEAFNPGAPPSGQPTAGANPIGGLGG